MTDTFRFTWHCCTCNMTQHVDLKRGGSPEQVADILHFQVEPKCQGTPLLVFPNRPKKAKRKRNG